jgi:hypothetical protein
MKRIFTVLSVAAVTALWSTAGMAQLPAGNHYLCHKVKDLRVPAKFSAQVGVNAIDQTGNFTGDAKKPFLLCNPANKDGNPIVNAALHYCCYKYKASTKVREQYDVSDQWGSLRLETKKPFLVCNPCGKALAP